MYAYLCQSVYGSDAAGSFVSIIILIWEGLILYQRHSYYSGVHHTLQVSVMAFYFVLFWVVRRGEMLLMTLSCGGEENVNGIKGDLEKRPSFLNVRRKHWEQPLINMGRVQLGPSLENFRSNVHIEIGFIYYFNNYLSKCLRNSSNSLNRTTRKIIFTKETFPLPNPNSVFSHS